jgi:hypothetical protein
MHRVKWLCALAVLSVATACRPTLFSGVDIRQLAYREGELNPTGANLYVAPMTETRNWKYHSWAEVQVIDDSGRGYLIADVILFTDKKELAKAYDEFLADETRIVPGTEDPEYSPPDVGYAMVGKRQPLFGGGSAINLTFQRCYALINVWGLFEPDPVVAEEDVYQYLQVLDDRLNNSVCPI